MNDTVHIDRKFEFKVNQAGRLKNIGMIEVYVTRCDLVRELKHAEIDPAIAARAFADELTEAMLPSSDSQKHNRMVHLVVRMYDGEERDTLTLINSGPFPCVHLATGKEPLALDRDEEEKE